MEAVMIGLQSSPDGKKDCTFDPPFFAPHNQEDDPLPGELFIFTSPLKSRGWLPRLVQLFKDLIGEPANTNLPDLNQENP